MSSPPDHKPREPRAAVLCHIMQWGMSHEQPGPLDQGKSPSPVRHFYLYVASDLHEQVEKAAAGAGLKRAPWLRHMVRQFTSTNFPESRQEARLEERSHDSHTYDTRFMLRLDGSSHTKLQQLITQFGCSKANIIRHLITPAEPEDFPRIWHMQASERRKRQPQQDGPTNDRERTR